MAVITLPDLLILAIGIGVLAVWGFLFVKGKQYDWMFEELEDRDYPVKDLYFVRYALIKLSKLQFKSKRDRQLRKEMGILHGEKYADYYLYVTYAQQLTIALTVLALATPFYFFTGGSLLAFLALVAFAGFAYYYYGSTAKAKVTSRSEELLSEFPDVVSKLALLINSGMILREAWERVAFSKEGAIYQEMRRSVVEMQNGMAEVDAIFSFGQRSLLPEIRKFSSTLIQGATKGNRDLAQMMTEQSKEMWAMKKQRVHRQGELANDKLILPMCITFIGILIMVIVPIFSGLGT